VKWKLVAAFALLSAAAPATGQPAPGVAPHGTDRCPAEHPVKGYGSRHSDGGAVYYLPGSARYDRVVPDRCFASETEARDAGYRAGREERTPARGPRR
jgi:hypothetical protein